MTNFASNDMTNNLFARCLSIGLLMIEELEKETLCEICFERMILPKALPCLHTFCISCITEQIDVRSSTIACPLCRIKIKVKNGDPNTLPTAFLVNRISEILQRYEEHCSMQIVEEIEKRCTSQQSEVNTESNDGNFEADDQEQLIKEEVESGSDQKRALGDGNLEEYIHTHKEQIDALVRSFRQRRASLPCKSQSIRNSQIQLIGTTALTTIELGQASLGAQRDDIGDTVNSLHQEVRAGQNTVLPSRDTATGQDQNANYPKFAATIESIPVCRKDGHSYKVLQTKRQYQTHEEITVNVVKLCSDGAHCNCWVDKIAATLSDGVEDPIHFKKQRSQNGGWRLASKLEKAGDFFVKVKVDDKLIDSFAILVASPTTGLTEV